MKFDEKMCMDGVKLIEGHVKIDIKTIPAGGGILFSLPMLACKEEKCKILALRIHKISNITEKTSKKKQK